MMHRTRKKKIVLMTGFSGRLATHFATHYAGDYELIGISRKEMTSQYAKVYQGEITQQSNELIEKILSTGKTIDVLINNAVRSIWKPVELMTTAEMLNQFHTNVIAPVELSNQFLEKQWKIHTKLENENANRSVVNISSIAGVKNYFGQGQGIYAATKAALNSITAHQASEWEKYGIRVNAIAPTSFPAYLTYDEVCQQIRAFIEGRETGEIKIMDKHTS